MMVARCFEMMLLATLFAILMGVWSVPFHGSNFQIDSQPPWRNTNDRSSGYGLKNANWFSGSRVPKRMIFVNFTPPPSSNESSEDEKDYGDNYNLNKHLRLYINKALAKENDRKYKEETIQDKILGGTVHCSNEQKACLRYHRLFVPYQKGCYHLHWKTNKCTVYVDEFHFKNNRKNSLQGNCRELKSETVNGICDNSVSTFLKHVFKGVRCTSEVCPHGKTCIQLKYERQTNFEGLCNFPDLRFDVLRMMTNESFMTPNLSRKQAKCVAEGKALKNNTCYSLLERGPCLEDQILVLDKTKYRSNRFIAKCIFEACGLNKKLMAFDGECHNEGEVTAALMPGERLLLNWFGEWYAAPESSADQEVKKMHYLPGDIDTNI